MKEKIFEFDLVKNHKSVPILVEPEEYEGVRRIAQKAANDIKMVTGIEPECISKLPKICERVILFATIGKGSLLEELSERKKLSLNGVEGYREVYGIRLVEEPWDGVRQALIVFGSEKRGTIYGIFHLSELIGVSPLVFWGDAEPAYQDEITVYSSIEMVSKEPSVKYRGFFINDEWPCFGNWTCRHFGGFTAKMYDNVFELLLRLKGNYLWPAMWSSSFALDGPGEENARLADLYGVIIGNSHHEPCIRAGEEWDIYKGENTPYGTEWNYVSNKEGLLKYWEDGLKRSGRYENIVTVGMRGERDSIMQGTQSLKENIEILKDIIKNQNLLIKKYVDHGDKKVPRLLAVYKEVEHYFYGEEGTEGLKEWDGLDSIILMLCEDNYGNMRFLPDERMRKHKGGYGMYYHLDYHGAPVSYEWMNSTPLVKIWEQMTLCYEYGIKEAWIVNVGDLKGNEFPLSYFMDLAYDFETWGTNTLDSPERYTRYWLKKQFGNRITNEQSECLKEILTTGIWLNSLRRPEALDSHTYHSCHYREADRILELVHGILSKIKQLEQELPQSCQNGFYSMISYPLQASMNLLKMQLYAGKNEQYAMQGKKLANRYGELVSRAIQNDKVLSGEFARCFYGKWSGMELETHIGFRKWNEDGCRYPVRMQVEPFNRPRMSVSRSDQMSVCVKNYAEPEEIVIRDFVYPGQEYVDIEIANDGIGSIVCQVIGDHVSWLSVSWEKKEIFELATLRITCIPENLPEQEEQTELILSDGDTNVRLVLLGKRIHTEQLPAMTFYENDGILAIHAQHDAKRYDGEKGQWMLLEGYGKTGCGLKAFPVDRNFDPGEGPSVLYRVAVEQEGCYKMEIWSAPSNPLAKGGRLQFAMCINSGSMEVLTSVSETFRGGEPENKEWCKGVLNQAHITYHEVWLHKGVNEILFFAVDAGFVLEGLLLYKCEKKVPVSYLGPKESWHSL